MTAASLAALDRDAAMLGVPATQREPCAGRLLSMLRRADRHLALSCDRCVAALPFPDTEPSGCVRWFR